MVDWVGVGVGAVAGLAAEHLGGGALFAHSKDWLMGQTFGRVKESSRRSEERRFGLQGEALLIGRDRHPVFVHQFAVNGFDPSLVTTELRPTRPIDVLVGELPEGLRPLSPGDVAAAVSAERTRLDESEHYWNGEKLALRRLVMKRDGRHERPTLHLGSEGTDYATYRAVGKAWEAAANHNPGLLADDDLLRSVLPGLSHSFGVNLTVETDDGQLLLTQRSSRTSGWNGRLHISANEGMAVDDLDANDCPDPYRTGTRGLREELGLDVTAELITFHSLILDLGKYEWAFLGHVDLRGTKWTASRLLAHRALGGAVDDWETTNPVPVPFTGDEVVSLLRADREWVPHGYLNLVLSAVHRFPRERTRILDAAIPVADTHRASVATPPATVAG